MFLQLAHLLKVKASDFCTNVCGSVANSINPAEQMNQLMASGINCNAVQYLPLNNGSAEVDPCLLKVNNVLNAANYIQPNNGQGGNASNNSQPNSQGICECSSINGSFYVQPNANGMCDCSLANAGQNSPNGLISSPYADSKPNFCATGSMMNSKPTVGNSILNAFDCRNSSVTAPINVAPYPTQNIIVGTTELPAVKNFRAYSSSCGNASNSMVQCA